MNILTKTAIAAAAWLVLATNIDLSTTEAALVIGALVIYQIFGEAP